MNYLNIFTRAYGFLHNYPGVPYWVFTPLRKIVRFGANRLLPRYLANVRKRKGCIEKNVIISFTSFPARINDVWMVVESLKNQSVLPEKIILWLSKEQFPTKEAIPESLWKEEDELFEIRIVADDIRSHKKFFYVMQEYPDKTFITCDDDIFYHPDVIKNLVDGSKKYPGCVIANTARHIQYDSKGDLLPYNNWKVAKEAYDTENLIQIGVGGVLYPPIVLHELTLHKDLFLSLTPMADDIWLNCMARLNGTPIVKSVMKFLPLPIENGSSSLSSINRGSSKNDEQLRILRDWLKDAVVDPYDISYKVKK